MKKLTPKKVDIISLIILGTGILVALFGFSRNMLSIITVGVVVMLSSLVFRIMFYRCPHCSKFLDRSRGKYCPYCGKEVNITK